MLMRDGSINLWKRKCSDSVGRWRWLVVLSQASLWMLDVLRCLLCLFLKSLTFSDHEEVFCLLPTRMESLHVNSIRDLTLSYSYSLQMPVVELWLGLPLIVQCSCGSSSSFSILSLSQELTSRKWPQKTQKLYLARYTHPLTPWHSRSAMCEYNGGTSFQPCGDFKDFIYCVILNATCPLMSKL